MGFVLNEHFFLLFYSLFTLRSSFSIFFLSLTFPTLAQLWCLKKKKRKSATLCFEPIVLSHKSTILLFFFPFLSLSWCSDRPAFLPVKLSMFPILGLMCRKGGGASVCSYMHNSMHHTVQMAVFFSLWLPQLNMSRGRAYAGHLYVWHNIELQAHSGSHFVPTHCFN